jgi:hypothetical protein
MPAFEFLWHCGLDTNDSNVEDEIHAGKRAVRVEPHGGVIHVCDDQCYHPTVRIFCAGERSDLGGRGKLTAGHLDDLVLVVSAVAFGGCNLDPGVSAHFQLGECPLEAGSEVIVATDIACRPPIVGGLDHPTVFLAEREDASSIPRQMGFSDRGRVLVVRTRLGQCTLRRSP